MSPVTEFYIKALRVRAKMSPEEKEAEAASARVRDDALTSARDAAERKKEAVRRRAARSIERIDAELRETATRIEMEHEARGVEWHESHRDSPR